MALILGRNSKKAFSLLGVLGFVALIDTSMITPIVASHARALGADPFWSGLVAGTYSLVALPMIVLSGHLSDVYGRRRMITLGLAGDLVVMVLYALSPSPPVLLSARILHAVFDSFIIPSALALIGDVFSKSVGRPLAFFWIFVAVAIVLGSGAATGLVSILGFQTVYAVIGVIVAACLVFALSGLPMAEGRYSRARGKTRLIAGYVDRVMISMLSVLSLYFIVGGVVGTLPTILIDNFGFDERGAAAQIGIFMVLSTAFSIPVFPIAARIAERKAPHLTLLLGLSASAASALFIEFGAGITVLRILSALIFGISLASIIFSSSFLVVTLPAEVRGLGSGLNQFATLLGVALSAPLTSLYVTTLGERGVFLLFGAVPSIAVAAIVSVAVRRLKIEPKA